MHDTLQIIADSYIALTAACAVTGLPRYIYGINKAYFNAEERVLKNRKLSQSSKEMKKKINKTRREFIFKESLKTFIPVYHVFNTAQNMVYSDRYDEFHESYFESRFEDIIDNENMNKVDYKVSKVVKKYIYKD